MGLDQRTALHLDLARRVGERRLSAIGVDIKAALDELVIGDRRGSRHQVAHIDLAGAAEDHAVTVHDHHRARALNLALDFAGACFRVIDAVEHRPGGLLLEIHRGVAPDVERLPIEDRLVGGLLNAHRGLAARLGLGRRLGIGPALGQAVVHLQAAFAEAVGNRRDLTERRLPTGRLRRLLRRNRRDRGVERADGPRQLLVDPRLLVQRRHRRHLPRIDPRRRRRLGRPLGREPRWAERRRRMGIARHHQQGNDLSQRLEAQHSLGVRALGIQLERGFAADHRESSFFVIARSKTGSRMRVRRLARGGTELLSCKVHKGLLTQKKSATAQAVADRGCGSLKAWVTADDRWRCRRWCYRCLERWKRWQRCHARLFSSWLAAARSGCC
ncbi:hypothetical protein ACVWXD_002584 [Pseudomonas sp. TE3911]